MRRLVEAAAASGVASVAATLAGFVRVKLYALLLGVAGVGVIAQIQNLHLVLAAMAMLGLGLGVSREVARARASAEGRAVEAILATTRTLSGSASLVLAAGLLLLAEPLSRWLLGDASYAPLLRLSAPAVAFSTLGRVLHEILNGYRDYRATAVATATIAAASVAILAPLVWLGGLWGAAAALPLVALASWIVTTAVFRRRHPELSGIGFGLRRGVLRTLLVLGAVTLAVGVAEHLALLVIRARLIHAHGLSGNGWFQGVWGLSQNLLNVTVLTLTSYMVARLSEARGSAELHDQLQRSVRMSLLLTTPMAAAMILLREPLVRTFLSPEFLPSVPFFPAQAGGILARALGVAMGIGLLAAAPARTWLLLGLSAPAAFVVSFVALSNSRGVGAASDAYLISGAIYLGLSFLLTRRHLRFSLQSRQRRLALWSGLLLIALAWLTDATAASYVLGAVLVGAWCVVAIRASEVRRAWAWLGELLRRD
jgi:O-antigen/teichoic acid export membrane protein